MKEFRRKVVGVVKRIDETFTLTHASATSFSEKVRYRAEFTILYGYRLECGHIRRCESGRVKAYAICFDCEMEAEGRTYGAPRDGDWLRSGTIYTRGKWQDASEIETRRIMS